MTIFCSERREAIHINTFFATLIKHINIIEGGNIVKAKLEIYELWRKLALIWINCQHFQNYDNIVVLIKVICNMIVAEVNNNRKKILVLIHDNKY